MQLYHRKPEKNKSSELMFAESIRNVMDKLIQLMLLEMELVTARKHKEHSALLKQKQRLTIDYRASLKSVATQPNILRSLPENIRVEIRATAQKLADVSDRNARFLRVSITATQRLIQNIIAIVKQEVLPKSGYRNPKTAHLQLGTYSPVCQSVAISRTV